MTEKYLFLFLTVSTLKAVIVSVSLLYLEYYLAHSRCSINVSYIEHMELKLHPL